MHKSFFMPRTQHEFRSETSQFKRRRLPYATARARYRNNLPFNYWAS